MKKNEIEEENFKKKESEQEIKIANKIIETLESKVSELKKSNLDFEKKLLAEHKMEREIEQEKIILSEVTTEQKKMLQKSQRQKHIIVAIALIVASSTLAYSFYENQTVVKGASRNMSDYNSNYIIQDLQGDTVDTWVSWNIQNDRIIHVHVVNEAKISQDMINALEDAIISNKIVSIDDSQTGKGPQGTSSTYYIGWQGADAQAYSEPTKLYIPQKFDINGSPDAVGDIEIILTNDVSPDGYSGYTKSIVDGHEILKSKITIFKANKLDADRLEAIIRHEFGHALGLGHSTAQEDLMHAMLPDYPYISECDIDALRGLYDGDQNSKVVCKK